MALFGRWSRRDLLKTSGVASALAAAPAAAAAAATTGAGLPRLTGLEADNCFTRIGVRPLIKTLRREPAKGGSAVGGDDAEPIAAPLPAEAMMDPETGVVDAELLSQQVGLAQRIVAEKPENAVVALRQMLNQPAAAQEAAQ